MRAQTFADNKTLTIGRNELFLRSCVKYIKASGTIRESWQKEGHPYWQIFQSKTKICPDLELEWDNRFKLLGINVNNNIQNIDEDIETVHARTQSLIND